MPPSPRQLDVDPMDALVQRFGQVVDEKLETRIGKLEKHLGEWRDNVDQKIHEHSGAIEQHSKIIDEQGAKIDNLTEKFDKLQTASFQSCGGGLKPDHGDDEERQLQVIGHGFSRDTNEQQLIDELKEIVRAQGFDDKVEEVFTFTDPASIGVIRFHKRAGVSTFLRRMKDVKVKLNNGKFMSFSINETLEQRKSGKPLGFIKFHINSKFDTPLKQIKIDRKATTVKVQGRLVAKPGGLEEDYGLVFMGEASEVKQEVKASMATWLDKVAGSE